VRRMETGKQTIECHESGIDVSVPELLYGIHISTHEQVMTDIKQGQQQLLQGQQQMLQVLLPEMALRLQELNQQSELIWRMLMRQWNFEMQRMEAECPNVFFLTLGSRQRFNPKNWVSQEYRLQLVCQHPPGPHPVGDGYSLREAQDWWVKMSPWLNHLVTFLKVAIPMWKAIGDVYDTVDFDHMKNQLTLVEEISKNIPGLASLDTLEGATAHPRLNRDQEATGTALRTLYSFLVQADPARTWGGLQRIVTPDGNILWLCEAHRQQYEAKPLDPRYMGLR
jgi:internalin A